MKIVVSLIALYSLIGMSIDVEAQSIKEKVKGGMRKKDKTNKKGTKNADESFFFKKPQDGPNPCQGMKTHPDAVGLVDNIQCVIDGVMNPSFPLSSGEQSGVNVTAGYQGLLEVEAVPITEPYSFAGLCPVNVHWHVGTEHYSVGEYDENGSGPGDAGDGHRNLAGEATPGFKCHYYDDTNPMFTEEYDWKYCVDTHVGETYEVHWPHSRLGACGTVNQYQSPFYDGVFCEIGERGDTDLVIDGKIQIGVQAQVFTIVNDEFSDENHFYGNLFNGMIVDGDKGADIAKYTGSTTGTTRSNEVCSQYTGITWQVDRKCHLISASSFDKMCAEMLSQRSDMSSDVYPHGSRELVADHLAANNQQRNLRQN